MSNIVYNIYNSYIIILKDLGSIIMEVKVLGCYGRFAPVGGATSGYLITTNSGKNIVIDLGSGCLSNLQKHIDIKDIDVIILSHLHFDHVSDVGVLKYALGFLGVKNVKLYMPQTPVDMFNIISGGYNVESICEGKVVEDFGVKIEFVANHHPVETFAVRVYEGNNLLTYTSDCMTASDVINNTRGSNFVIGDACILDKDWCDTAPHVSVKMLSESVPKDCVLYLAHLTSGLENEILLEAKKYHYNSQLVNDFKVI